MGIGKYFYNKALNPKTDKEFVEGELDFSEEEKKLREEKEEWVKSIATDEYIETSNNGKLKLHAYQLLNKEETNIWVIVIHGYMIQGLRMAEYAHAFYNKGYNVLLPDLRGHGLSNGDYIGMGWHDRLDIIDWINYIIKKDEKAQIILFGISMGAATTMMTTGEKLPKNVKIAIEDCGYTSAWEQFAYNLKQIFHMPKFPVLYLTSNICKKKANYSLKEASSIEQLKKSKIPTLFIHGSSDTFVPFEMLDKVYNSASCEKEKLIIEGAGHGKSAHVDSELYWKTIDKFINKYI